MNGSNKKINLGMIFGSRSVEHEVSIITALQVIHATDKSKYNTIPIYIDKKGDWFTGNKLTDLENFNDLSAITKGMNKVFISSSPTLQYSSGSFFGMKKSERLDVVFPLIHGTFGEDGTLQGLLEFAGIPYTGAGVLASAIGMDKVFTKKVLTAHQLPVTKYISFSRKEYFEKPDAILSKIKEKLRFPLFVKPSNLGSSVGINKVESVDKLNFAIEVASEFDSSLLVEEGVEEIMEINCSVLGNTENPKPSVCEQPLSGDELLSYKDKYCSGSKNSGMKGTNRILPADIPDALTAKIQEMAVKAFKAINGYGIARIDFLINKKNESIFVNEINTIPGSLSFYLWEASGMKFSQLIDELVELAITRHRDRTQTTYSYDSNILNQNFGSKSGAI
ncbi:MAG TPA: D-alanine--D-alanine ligase family protein [Nitrospinota bacterium]|nr:D-alanine--D-alanine ligase family protein [Nitrospinota bacterium]